MDVLVKFRRLATRDDNVGTLRAVDELLEETTKKSLPGSYSQRKRTLEEKVSELELYWRRLDRNIRGENV